MGAKLATSFAVWSDSRTNRRMKARIGAGVGVPSARWSGRRTNGRGWTGLGGGRAPARRLPADRELPDIAQRGTLALAAEQQEARPVGVGEERRA